MILLFIKIVAQKIDLYYTIYGDIMNLSVTRTQKGTKSFPMHRHADFEIVFYPSTTVTLCTQEKVYTIHPGNIVLIPPDTLHSSYSDTELDGIYIRGIFNQLFQLNEPTVINDNKYKEGKQLAIMIYNNRFGNKEYLSSLCDTFIHFLVTNMKFEDNIAKAVSNIISEITRHAYDWNINLTDILKSSGYAEDYIRSHFKKTTGKTPVEFLTHIRIDHARFLIETYGTTMSLSQIAEKCGYIDYIYFSRKFNQIMGISPRKFISETLC